MYVTPERECVLSSLACRQKSAMYKSAGKNVSVGKGVKGGVSRSFGPDDHPRMDRATDLAVHGPGLSIDNEDCFVGSGDQVSTEHSCTGDGAVRVTPFCCSSIHGAADACYHLHFAVRQIDEKDVLLSRGAGVQVVVVCCTGWEKCYISNLEGCFDIK